MQKFMKEIEVIILLSLMFLLTGCQKHESLQANPEDQLAISIIHPD